MKRISHPSFQHIEAGRRIDNGYPGGYCTAPSEPGFYTLYEIADESNCHVGWTWEKEDG